MMGLLLPVFSGLTLSLIQPDYIWQEFGKKSGELFQFFPDLFRDLSAVPANREGVPPTHPAAWWGG